MLSNVTRFFALVGVCALMSSALAQTATAPAVDVPVPDDAAAGAAKAVAGKVNGTSVYVRSGPGTSAYPCTKLSSPATVQVLGKASGWYKILPPPGCFSVIAKEFVQLDPTGKIGSVIGDNVWVRAAGELRGQDFWHFQLRLNKGDRVDVLGEIGSYYKIVPPKGAFYWISAQFVKTEGEPLVEEGAEPADTVKVAKVEDPAAKTARDIARKISSPAPAAPAAAGSLADWKDCEKMLEAEWTKAADQRDLNGLLAKYQAIKLEDNDYLKPYVEARVKFLQDQAQLRKDREDADRLARTTKADQDKFDAERRNIQIKQPVAASIEVYAAEGVLFPSEMFSGGPMGKKYIVRDVQTNRIDAYVQCTTGAVDLDALVGKYVAIKGSTSYDRQLGRDIVEAREVIPSPKAVSVPELPKPIVKPLAVPPPPAPTPLTVVSPAATKVEPKAPPKVEPKAEPIAPKVEPAPVAPRVEIKAPATKPAEDNRPSFDLTGAGDEKNEPLPDTGLPVVHPTTKPAPKVD